MIWKWFLSMYILFVNNSSGCLCCTAINRVTLYVHTGQVSSGYLLYLRNASIFTSGSLQLVVITFTILSGAHPRIHLWTKLSLILSFLAASVVHPSWDLISSVLVMGGLLKIILIPIFYNLSICNLSCLEHSIHMHYTAKVKLYKQIV